MALNYITLFWLKPGSSNTEVFDPNFGKQYEPMTGFCYGVNGNNENNKFETAFSKLMQPIWDGKRFFEHIPVLPDLPQQYITTDIPVNHYPETLPPLRLEFYRAMNQNDIKSNGAVTWYYLPARDSQDLAVWDLFGITHWEDPLVSGDEFIYIENPAYVTAKQDYDQIKAEYRENFTKQWANGYQLTLIGKVIFPVIPDTPDTKWRLVENGIKVPIPVEVGKYPPSGKYRWRKVIDFQTQNRGALIDMYINGTLEMRKEGMEEDSIIKYLCGL